MKLSSNNCKDNDQEEGLTLLLLFKDSLTKLAEKGFPLIVSSASIKAHRAVSSDPKPKPIASFQQPLFDRDLSRIGFAKVPDIPDECCVWGWWRKPWENNNILLEYFFSKCQSGSKPKVLLYNQYLRRIYKATLHFLYWIRAASTVEIPPSWVYRCPDYYSRRSNFCGAFFVLKIDKPEEEAGLPPLVPSDIFRKYYIDSFSFDIDNLRLSSVISPPVGVVDTCINMIDKSPDPYLLKSSEHTMFALRKKRQKDIAIQQLASNASESDISSTILKMVWPDIVEILRKLNIDQWRLIYKSHIIRNSISIISSNSNANIINFDILLVSWAISHYNLLDVLFAKEGSNDISDAGKALIEWLLEEDDCEKRRKAALYFECTWNNISTAFELSDLTEYFKQLPEIEELIHTTQHGFEGKFFRDHLNHNIRAAMLAGYLSSKLSDSKSEDGLNEVFICYLGGLLHDIAFPISVYGNISKSIRKALSKLNIDLYDLREESAPATKDLRRSLSIAASLSSIRNLYDKQKKGSLFDYIQGETKVSEESNKLLFEQMLCAMSLDHSILGATVVFKAALDKTNTTDYNASVRQIINRGSGPGKTKYGVAFLNLIQCIALHDRKSAIDYYGVFRQNVNSLTPLPWDQFKLPAIVAVADELQEWGRPLANIDDYCVKGAKIDIDNSCLYASYDILSDSAIFADSPFCFFESVFGKIRKLFPIIRYSEKINCIKYSFNIKGEMNIVHLGGPPCLIKFELTEGEQNGIVWPEDSAVILSIAMDKDKDLYGINHPQELKNSKDGIIISDLLVVEGDLKDREYLNDVINNDGVILKFEIEDDKLIIQTRVHMFEFIINRYYYSKLDDNSTVPNEGLLVDKPMSVLMVKIINISKNVGYEQDDKELELHLKPFPHFLDYDWRFSWKTIKSILIFIKCNYAEKKICYLGCPTLAMYHDKYLNLSDFYLFDKGHFGIEAWKKSRLIKDVNYVRYNVCDTLDEKYRGYFDVVIIDPPWYEEYYKLFWNRSLELIKPKGTIGVSEYPGYKDSKLKIFNRIRDEILEKIDGKDFFASIEISYEIPEFEKSWEGHEEYERVAFGAYRPTYMDFYQIDVPPRIEKRGVKEEKNSFMKSKELKGGHYFRHRHEIDFDRIKVEGIKFETYSSLKRYRTDDCDIIGWTTKNTRIKYKNKVDGIKPSDMNELIEAINDWERN